MTKHRIIKTAIRDDLLKSVGLRTITLPYFDYKIEGQGKQKFDLDAMVADVQKVLDENIVGPDPTIAFEQLLLK